MKAEINTQIQINATSEKVWEVLTKMEDYPKWNPFVRSMKGRLVEGEKIKVALPGMNFNPIVQEVKEKKRFSWLGKLGIKGIFDGHHQFELVANEQGTLFIHKESFAGLLVKWFMNKKASETKEGFIAMNEALKRRVEKIQVG